MREYKCCRARCKIKEKNRKRKYLGGAHALRDEAGSGSHPACFSAPGEEKEEKLANTNCEELLKNENNFQKEISHYCWLRNMGGWLGRGAGASGVPWHYWSHPSTLTEGTGG